MMLVSLPHTWPIQSSVGTIICLKKMVFKFINKCFKFEIYPGNQFYLHLGLWANFKSPL